jgi:hypothetical protein
MKPRKERSIFWVATTHALTTGFVMPLVGAMAGGFISGAMTTDRNSLLPFYVYLLFILLGYAGGAAYSMAYIRKVAILHRPSEHVVPSIIAVMVLVLLGTFVSLCFFGGTTFRVVLIVLQSALATAVMAVVTAKGFQNWPFDEDLQPTKPVSLR